MPRPIAPFGRLVRTLAAVATVLAAAATAACFRSDTVIHVKADGTGTIEQTNLANKQMLGMAAGMAKSAAQEAGADASKTPSLDNIGDLFDEARIREQASTFGEGVRFVSSEPLTQDGLTGVKAVFAFEDVRLLNLSNGRSATGGAAPQLRFDLPRHRIRPRQRIRPRPLLPRRLRRGRRSRPRRWRWSATCSRARG